MRQPQVTPRPGDGFRDASEVSAPAPPRANGPEPATANGRAVAPAAPVQPTERSPMPPRTAAGGARVRITVEAALWLLLVGAAALTRFWDLGSRTLHHDESLHAYYSWLLATGQGYVHDPLMHGPILFHLGALFFFLFGASDALVRVPMAVSGVVLVALPFLLRGPRHLGRWGALAASLLLLVSPALLYQTRYLRHDTYTVVGTLLLFIAFVRYVERPERRWLVTIGATLGFLLTSHEIIFGIAAIFFGVVAGALLWGRLRRVAPIVVATAGAALLLIRLLPEATGRPLPEIPWRSPTQQQQFDFYRDLLTNPLTIALALLLVVGLAASCLILVRAYGPARPPEGWVDRVLGGGPVGSVQEAVRAAWADRTGLSVAIASAVIIFVVFFTTLFTNLYGLASGTIATDGTLFYWLGQQEYRRGEQPWFYYLLLFPQYEFVAVLFGGAATLLVAVRAVRVALGRAAPGPRFFFQTFLAVWFVGIFAALSWAGEKMPWLVIHITLPATLLAAVLLGELAERWRAPRSSAAGWGWPEWGLATGLLVAGAAWILLAARLTFGVFTPSADPGGWDRTLPSAAVARWWLLAVPPIVALLGIGAAALRRGARRAGAATLVALVAGLALLQIHTAWRLTYQEGDIPKDMLIYTQTSPDVSRMVRELTLLSEELTGGNGLEIWYDSGDGTSWPMQWYLRDFPNRRLFGSNLTGPPEGSPPVLLVASNNYGGVEPFMDGYTAQEYVLRWWFPEQIYRDFAIAPEIAPGRSAWQGRDDPSGPVAIAGSIVTSLSALLRPEEQAQLFRLLMYRDLPYRIDSYDYKLYVRNDLLPLFNTIRY